jgi:hypothetical protein
MALVATLNVGIAVLRHWKGFDLTNRFVSVVLLASLVTIPLMSLLNEKTAMAGKRVVPGRAGQELQAGYMWLLLAVLVFSR